MILINCCGLSQLVHLYQMVSWTVWVVSTMLKLPVLNQNWANYSWVCGLSGRCVHLVAACLSFILKVSFDLKLCASYLAFFPFLIWGFKILTYWTEFQTHSLAVKLVSPHFLHLSFLQENLIHDENKLILLASLSDSLEYVADSIERQVLSCGC